MVDGGQMSLMMSNIYPKATKKSLEQTSGLQVCRHVTQKKVNKRLNYGLKYHENVQYHI